MVSETETRSREVFAGYTPHGEGRPLAAYAGLAGVYNGALAAALLAAKRQGRPLPERVGTGDIVLLGVATHKLGRLLAKDWVTSPLRAPFATYKGASGIPSEVDEGARGAGLQRAIGELVT